MNWDQIEKNWLAMTRRVRPEPTELRSTQSADASAPQPIEGMIDTAVEWAEGMSLTISSASQRIE